MKYIALILLSLCKPYILSSQNELDKHDNYYLVCHTHYFKNKPSYYLQIFYIVKADIVDSFENKMIGLNCVDGSIKTIDYLLYHHKKLGIYEVVDCNGWIEGDYFRPDLSADVFNDNIEFSMQIGYGINRLNITKIRVTPQLLNSTNYGHIRTDQYVCFNQGEVERIPIEDQGHSILFYLMTQLLN